MSESGNSAFWQVDGYGIAALSRNVFNATDGVPEFESWGGEDDLFRNRIHEHVDWVRERCEGLRHQWHPDHCRDEHYERPRHSDYLGRANVLQEEGVLGAKRSDAVSIDPSQLDERREACLACSQCAEVDAHTVRCMASGSSSISLAQGRCKLRKWQHTIPRVRVERITCSVFEGLTNRINGIASAIATGKHVFLMWAVNAHCPMRFEEVFRPIPDLEVAYEVADSYPYVVTPDQLCWFYPRNVMGLERDVFRRRLYAAYQTLLEHMISPEADRVPAPALGLHYRHHLPEAGGFEDYVERVLRVIGSLQPRGIYLATDSEGHRNRLVDVLEDLPVKVLWGKGEQLQSDLDRTVGNVKGLMQDLLALSSCRLGVITNSTRSSVPDILRGAGVPSYATFDDGSHRYNGRDDLFERKHVDDLIPAAVPRVMEAKQSVRIQLEGFWTGFELDDFRRMFRFLDARFAFEVHDEPDLVITSVFGDQDAGRKRWPNARHLFFTGENRSPPLDKFDYCLSFYRDSDDPRHLRCPVFLPHLHSHGYAMKNLIKSDADTRADTERQRFCAFIATNGGASVRNRFVQALSEYKAVDCPGVVLNNMPSDAIGPPGDAAAKVRFLKRYRYAVCFENTSTWGSEGYVTEKLTDAMLAGCIPLYWGDHRVEEDFNPGSLIDLTRFGDDVEAMVRHVAEIDQNPIAIQAIIKAAWLPNNQIPKTLAEETIQSYFEDIFIGVTARRLGVPPVRIAPTKASVLCPGRPAEEATGGIDGAHLH